MKTKKSEVSVQASVQASVQSIARECGRYAGTKKNLLLPILALLLTGCVNLHVHFPDAAEKTGGEATAKSPDAGSGAVK